MEILDIEKSFQFFKKLMMKPIETTERNTIPFGSLITTPVLITSIIIFIHQNISLKNFNRNMF